MRIQAVATEEISPLGIIPAMDLTAATEDISPLGIIPVGLIPVIMTFVMAAI